MRTFQLFTFYFLLLTFLSCEEIPPVVTGSMGPVGPPPDVEQQERQVLIEEFTGVRCVNCPAGSAAIEDLRGLHGHRLVAVSLHAGEFAPPYSASAFDFRTSEGEQILSYLGEPFGYPTAAVNRRLFENEFDLQLGQAQWAGFIAEELAVAPKVKIDIEPAFNAVTRNLSVQVTLYVQEDITDPEVRLSVMISESNIVDLQLTPASATPKPDYSHQHVLRGMMTNFDGAPITETLAVQAVIERNFNLTLPVGWKEGDCHVVAFVHLSGDSKEVLQAHEEEVIQ